MRTFQKWEDARKTTRVILLLAWPTMLEQIMQSAFAPISALNAQFAWATKPILQGCDDGWLPHSWGWLHPKFKTPIVLLSILYAIAVICIVSGLSVSILGNLCVVMTTLAAAIISSAMWKLPQLAPKGWAQSKFRVGKTAMGALAAFCTACAVFNIYLNVTQLSMPLILGNVAMLVISIIYAQLRLPKVTMDPSYEEIVDN